METFNTHSQYMLDNFIDYGPSKDIDTICEIASDVSQFINITYDNGKIAV